MGEEVSEFIWYWNKGSIRVYTRSKTAIERARKEGFFIFGKKIQRIFSGKK